MEIFFRLLCRGAMLNTRFVYTLNIQHHLKFNNNNNNNNIKKIKKRKKKATKKREKIMILL